MADVRRGGRYRKTQRLRLRREYDRVQNGSSTFKAGSRHFLVLIARRESVPTEAATGSARLGVIASRRVGSAVRRNRAKRLVREFFRTSAAERKDLKDLDVVVVVKTGADALTLKQVEGELSSALRRAVEASERNGRPATRPKA